MLTEFALTPDLFDESRNPDLNKWIRRLIKLNKGMTRSGDDPMPVIVSNLRGSAWHYQTELRIGEIKDEIAKEECEELIDAINDVLVHRPCVESIKSEPGKVEKQWLEEIIGTHQIASIDRIVATDEAAVSFGNGVRRFSEVLESGFWRGIGNSKSPPPTISDQVQLLAPMCLFSEFICLVSPFFNPTSQGDYQFAREVIRASFNRPSSFGQIKRIEIHTQVMPGHNNPVQYLEEVGKMINGTLGNQEVFWVVGWDNLRERYLCAGDLAASGGKRVRWSFNLSHVEREGTISSGMHEPDWTHLPKGKSLKLYNKYFSPNVTGFHGPVRVVPNLD